MATCRRFQATFLVALLALHASFVTGRINQDDPSIRGGPLLIGEWTALKGRIVSVPEESAQSSAGSIQMELEKEGAVLKGSFTGFVPGSTYDLLLRLRSDTPIELVISVGSDPIVASVVDEGTAHVGQFVATTKSETLQIALYGSEEGARVYLDEVSIYPETSNRREMIVVFPDDPCPDWAPNFCWNFDESSKACCDSLCGRNVGPVATCAQYCTFEAPNPCFNYDGQNMTCCPGSCGPSDGPVATCADPNPTPTPPLPTAPPGEHVPPAPAGFQWVVNPALTDEFNGNSLDRSKWQPIIPYYSGRLPSQYSTANVAVGGGYARLTSTTTVTNVNQVADPYNDPWISAAALASTSPVANVGFYETRMKASNLLMTSSFWFQSVHTETDVTETIGNTTNFRSHYMPINTHYYPTGRGPSQTDQSTPYFYRLPTGTITSADFHVYGFWWQSPTKLHFFFDGQLAVTLTPMAPFTESSYLFFDTEVFKQYGLPDVAALKDPSRNVFLMDYVRAYTLVPTKK